MYSKQCLRSIFCQYHAKLLPAKCHVCEDSLTLPFSSLLALSRLFDVSLWIALNW